MLQKLKNKSGEVMIIAMVMSVLVMCGIAYLDKNQKNVTPDTIENPNIAEWDR